MDDPSGLSTFVIFFKGTTMAVVMAMPPPYINAASFQLCLPCIPKAFRANTTAPGMN